MTTMEEDAAAIRDAFGDGQDVLRFHVKLGALWADDFVLTHDPPIPSDGLMHGREMVEIERKATAEMIDVVPDFRQEEIEVIVNANETITGNEVRTGTLPDGTVFRIPNSTVFTFRAGKIVNAHVTVNRDNIAPLMAAMGEGREWGSAES